MERYDVAHPAPADVLLIVEVGDTSLQRDRGGKDRASACGLVSEPVRPGATVEGREDLTVRGRLIRRER